MSTPQVVLSEVFADGGKVSGDFIKHLATSGFSSEITNHPGTVRNFIYQSAPAPAKKRVQTGMVEVAFAFAVYQTGRLGPQNGFRLVIVNRGFKISSREKAEGAPEDEIDALEKLIPEGHMEVVVLGKQLERLPEDEGHSEE